MEKGQPTKPLLLRLDTAEKYLERYPDAKLILTGGNADRSGKTEAETMRELLAAKKAGFTNIKRLPAPSPFFEYGENMLSEVYLTVNELTRHK